tara:strand:- start:41 stop:379 length:339 start_codon:yes stop_codon:yes gene_type:complete
MNTNTFLTNKDRERYAAQFKVMLVTCHENLLSLCNERKTEDINELPEWERFPAKRIALNKRINAQNERIEDLLLSIEYGEPCPDNSFLTAGDTATAVTPAEIKADIAEAFSE